MQQSLKKIKMLFCLFHLGLLIITGQNLRVYLSEKFLDCSIISEAGISDIEFHTDTKFTCLCDACIPAAGFPVVVLSLVKCVSPFPESQKPLPSHPIIFQPVAETPSILQLTCDGK